MPELWGRALALLQGVAVSHCCCLCHCFITQPHSTSHALLLVRTSIVHCINVRLKYRGLLQVLSDSTPVCQTHLPMIRYQIIQSGRYFSTGSMTEALLQQMWPTLRSDLSSFCHLMHARTHIHLGCLTAPHQLQAFITPFLHVLFFSWLDVNMYTQGLMPLPALSK